MQAPMSTRHAVPRGRRRFLALGLGATGAGLLVACSPIGQPPAATPGPAGAAAQASPAAPAVPAASKPIAPAAPAAPASPAATTGSPAAGASPAAPASPAAAAKPAASAPVQARRGGTFTYLRTADVRSFNPTILDPTSNATLRAFYNSLVRYDLNLNVVPELAETFELAQDGKSITLTLRKGVKFQSGREVVADDVAFSIDWYKDAKNGSPIRGMVNRVGAVETPAPDTVILRFDNTNPSIYDMLDVMFILDKNGTEQLAQRPAGTGPFRLAEYRPAELLRMVPNPEYWDPGKPHLGDYILKPAPDAQAMALALEAGQADAVVGMSFPDFVRLGNDARFVGSTGAPGASFYDIAVNTSVPNLSDKRVRQAISLVLDRERFARTVMQGIVEPTSLPVPKTSWAHFPELDTGKSRDVQKARGLMAAAGKADGFDVQLLTASKRNPGYIELAQILQANLQEINIRASIEDVEVAVYEPRSMASQFELMVHNYGRANKDPGTLFTGAIAWFPKGSWTKFESADYTNLVTQGGNLVDREQRKPIYRQLMQLVLDECFTIVVCQYPSAFVWQKRVQDFSVSLDNIPYVGEFWLSN